MKFRLGYLEVLRNDAPAKRCFAQGHHVIDIVRAIILVFQLYPNRLAYVLDFSVVKR